MGSPPIAVPALEALSRGFDVALVVTQPDRPKGRGRKVAPTAVHAKADELQVPVHPCSDVNAADCLAEIERARPDAVVVVSFGQMLKSKLLELPRLGCINLHFSLLPELRGAAPVSWAIMNGLSRTGVSVMRMSRKMDAGAVFAQAEEPIRADDTAATLSARLGTLGAGLLVETVAACFDGKAEARPQDDAKATFAPKITRGMCAIHWRRDAVEVDRLIRGLAGQLEAYAYFDKEPRVRVTFHGSVLPPGHTPGTGIAARGKQGELFIGCGNGMIEAREVQAEGRRRVTGREFANGYHIKGGETFGNG